MQQCRVTAEQDVFPVHVSHLQRENFPLLASHPAPLAGPVVNQPCQQKMLLGPSSRSCALLFQTTTAQIKPLYLLLKACQALQWHQIILKSIMLDRHQKQHPPYSCLLFKNLSLPERISQPMSLLTNRDLACHISGWFLRVYKPTLEMHSHAVWEQLWERVLLKAIKNQLHTSDLCSSREKCRNSKNIAYSGEQLCASKPSSVKIVTHLKCTPGWNNPT